MAYIGNIPAEAYISISSQTFTTINGTDYTLSSSVESSEDIALFLNNVRQKPSTYTATGTALTMGTATTTADELYCVYLGKALQTVNPGAGSVGTAQIADLAVTSAKLAGDAVTTAKILDDNVTTAKILDANVTTPKANFISTSSGAGVISKGTSGDSDGYLQLNCSENSHGIKLKSPPHSAAQSYTLTFPQTAPATDKYLQTDASGNLSFSTVTEYDDNQVQSNIAMLGFKVATNGSLVKYNLVDQTIDEFNDTSGVDASASTNEVRSSASPYYYFGGTSSTPTVTEDADDTGVDGDYTWYKWTDTGSTGSYNNDTTQDHEWLVVGGGGSGYANRGAGGGGAGGYRTGTTLSLTGGNAYTITIGAGGAAPVSDSDQTNDGGDSIISGTGITTITSTGGGGAGGHSSGAGHNGGSGGGATNQQGTNTSVGSGNTPAITQYTAAGETTTVQGYNGGTSTSSGSSDQTEVGGGGGGASSVGTNATLTAAGNGGDGYNNDITGSTVGYAGGGGAASNNSTDTGGTASHGGGAGHGRADGNGDAGSGTANTGGGGGGHNGQNNSGTAGAGGSGVVILRRLTSSTVTGENLTLQSTDTTASTAPTYGEFVTLIENAEGTATLNTDIKGYISRDSGTTFTQGTLVDEGTWGTNKKVLGFHDLDISSQPSGTDMCYKITTHNQSAGSKETKIHATSIGWK